MKLKEIKSAAWNTRGTIAPESVKELAQSIAEQGLINPITIWMDANGELAIKWSYSKAEKDRLAEEERKREEAEDAERDAENDREDEIIERLNEWKRGDKSGKAAVGIIELVGKCLVPGVATEVFDFCFDAIADRITGWHCETEWATMLSAFPEIADYAGVSNEDREWFIERHQEETED